MTRGSHPAFLYSPQLAETVFENGYADGPKTKNIDTIWNPLTKGIGDIHQGMFGQTVSYMWAFPWQVAVYEKGLRACKEKWSSDQIDRYLYEIKSQNQSKDRIAFRADIRLQPSLDDNGAITREADPSDLANVRVFLRVENREYLPLQQPGHVEVAFMQGTTDVTIPGETTTTERIVVDRKEKKRTKKTTETKAEDTHETVEYTWYRATFDFWFDLRNEDRTYRINPSDKEIDIVIFYGENERHAKFNLDDFTYTKRKFEK